MSTKGFILMLVGVLTLGGVLGGSFFGGLALGKNQADEDLPSFAVLQAADPQPETGAGAQPSDQPNLQTLAELRQRVQSGDASQEELAELRQQLQAQFGQGGGGQGPGAFGGDGAGFGGRGGLVGTIENIDGQTVTVNTPQGLLEATIGADTTIQMTTVVELELDDLEVGMRLTIGGQRSDDGAVEATTILVLPEGDGGLFGGGAGGFRGGFGGGGFGGHGGGRGGQ
jgi:hypothetical protein